MGIIQKCNLCKTPQEIGEVDINQFHNNLKAKKNFEIKLRSYKNISIIRSNDNDISKIRTSFNISMDDIELPSEIINKKPQNGFKSELIKFDNGDTYQGYYNENNLKNGYGEYIKKNGFVYKGIWKNDKIEEYGLFIDPKGNYFKGNLIKGLANGEGEIMINNKLKYIGYFTDNLPNKKGKLINLIDNSIYEGDFINGIREGRGVMKFIDGTMYEGNFMNDKYEGFGKLTYNNGTIYEGEFKNNLFNGKGKYRYNDGKEYYGDFCMGFKHGFGKLSWNENKYYEGYWINNNQHGEGMFYLNGKVLKGIFRYGKMIMKNK